jgi:ribonucleoside-diphosphate reductase alpha chain
MDAYQQYIHKSRYARYLPEEQRRETWEETVNRYLDYWCGRVELNEFDQSEIFNAIYELDVMPSMRALMTAGEALDRDNVAGFNCSYMPIDHPKAFDEMMYVLMCGTGVGFSVERQYITKLPEIAEDFHETDTVIHVSDSKVGWAKAYRELISLLYSGQLPKWDVSELDLRGPHLKPSGVEHLVRNLLSICLTSPLKSFGRLLDANLAPSSVTISAVRLHRSLLLEEFGEVLSSVYLTSLTTDSADANQDTRSGERGMFSRVASQKQAAKNERRDATYDFGTNPCSEIILRPYQFCNLSEVVVRAGDTLADLKRKVRVATILGTLQATLTDFRYLRKVWQKNTEEEALLGVSLTGIMDHTVLSGREDREKLKEWLIVLKEEAISTNAEWSKRLGINMSAAITAVKPSGTVSQLVDSASGIHPRYSDQYIRRVRADARDPLCKILEAAGVPVEDDVMSPSTKVFSFPIKSPDGAVVASEMGAMEQLELWEIYQDFWCEHKPSMTCYYRDNEFLEVGQWLYNKFDKISGVSFLPYSEHTYQQAPYEPVDVETYEKLKAEFPESIDWAISENSDMTEGSQQLACTGNNCEL